MKRTYTWRHKSTGKTVEVRRFIDDYNVPPRAEEIADQQLKSSDNGAWVKLVDAAAITGNLQKGNYGRC